MRKGASGAVASSLQSQAVRSRLPLVVLLLTLRIQAMNYLTTDFSKRYLAENCGPILSKVNPNKAKLIKSMNNL